jgi:hypothetical protein
MRDVEASARFGNGGDQQLLLPVRPSQTDFGGHNLQLPGGALRDRWQNVIRANDAANETANEYKPNRDVRSSFHRPPDVVHAHVLQRPGHSLPTTIQISNKNLTGERLMSGMD